MNKYRWTEGLEYLSLIGSGVGVVASVVYQQAALASTPLSLALVLNLINRRRLDQQLNQGFAPTLDRLDQEMTQEIEALQSLQQQVLTMPQPDQFASALDTAERSIVQQTQELVSQAEAAIHDRLAALEAIDVSYIQQEITHLQNHCATLQTSLLDVNLNVAELTASDRIAHLEATLVKVVAMLDQHQRSLQDLATTPPAELITIQEQVHNLQQRLNDIPTPFDGQELEQEIAILREEMDSILKASLPSLSRQDFAATVAEITNLRHSQSDLQDSIVPLSNAIATLQAQLDNLTQEFATRPDSSAIEALRQGLIKLFHRCEEMRQQVNALKTIAPAADWQTELQAAIVAHTATLQQDLEQEFATIQATITAIQSKMAEIQANSDEQVPVQVEILHRRLESLANEVNALQAQPSGLVEFGLPSSNLPNTTAIVPLSATPPLGNGSTIAPATGDRPLLVAQLAPLPQPELQQLDTLPQSQQHLIAALATAQERVVIAGNWFGQPGLDDRLRRRLRSALNRGVCIDLDCVALVKANDLRFPRRIHHQGNTTQPHSGAVRVLHDLLDLQGTYPDQLNLKALGLQEWFLICDRSYAIVPAPVSPQTWADAASLDESPVPYRSLLQFSNPTPRHQPSILVDVTATDVEADHIRSTDPTLIQALLAQFDYPGSDLATASAYFTRAAIHYELGESDVAVTDYADALQLNPHDALAYNNRGLIYYELGDVRRAIADFDQALTVDPENAIVYANRGTVRAEIGDRHGAIADYTNALEQCPTDDITYNNRGLLRSRLGDRQGAIADYTAAVHLKPNDDIAYFNRGAARASLGDYEGALVDYGQAIRINPYFANAHNNRGFAQQKLGNRTAALADFTQAIRINPNFANAYNNRGITRSKLGDFQGAIADFDHVIRINPEFANAYNNRGTVRSKLGDLTGALADFDQAIAINPEFANAYNNRGLAHADMGNVSAAGDDLLKAARLFANQGDEPSSQQALQKLKLLSGL